MSTDKFKIEFARAISTALRQLYPDKLEANVDGLSEPENILRSIEKPKDPSHGRYAFPVFKLCKQIGDKPQNIAKNIASQINKLDSTNAITTAPMGGYINASVSFKEEATEVLSEAIEKVTGYGSSTFGRGKKVLVEYSAPNIAKPFSIGHLRTTILGNSLRLIFKKLGYESIGINYLGDWGTQFGKMIVAHRKWADFSKANSETVQDLLELYIRFHDEVEVNPELENEARLEFRKLEEGDTENTRLWERFREISLSEFSRVYDLMGVEFDWITGEAYLNDKMNAVIDRLEKNKLTSISHGALVVDLNDPQLPPCLLRKADGATLYATRDIAGFLYRWNKYQFDEMLYVVASNQSDHFKQVFRVIELLEIAEKVPESERIFNRARHVDFGLIKFDAQVMSTRRGNIIFLEDVINKAADLAKEKIREKNPSLKDIDETALMIGLGAVFFSQLSVRRQKDVNFNWEDVLSFEGETGPYLQYTHARLCSLMRNYGGEVNSRVDFKLLDQEEERRVVELIADFPDVIVDAARTYEPNLISTHLLKLAAAFNKFYQRKDTAGRIDKIISENESLSKARMALVKATQVVIKEGLRLLGIKAPEEM